MNKPPWHGGKLRRVIEDGQPTLAIEDKDGVIWSGKGVIPCAKCRQSMRYWALSWKHFKQRAPEMADKCRRIAIATRDHSTNGTCTHL